MGRDHSCDTCGLGGMNSNLVCICNGRPNDYSPETIELNRITDLLINEWQRVEHQPVNISYVATFVDMARVIMDQFVARSQFTKEQNEVEQLKIKLDNGPSWQSLESLRIKCADAIQHVEFARREVEQLTKERNIAVRHAELWFAEMEKVKQELDEMREISRQWCERYGSAGINIELLKARLSEVQTERDKYQKALLDSRLAVERAESEIARLTSPSVNQELPLCPDCGKPNMQIKGMKCYDCGNKDNQQNEPTGCPTPGACSYLRYPLK